MKGIWGNLHIAPGTSHVGKAQPRPTCPSHLSQHPVSCAGTMEVGRVEGRTPLPRMHRGLLAEDQGQGEGLNHGQGYLKRPVSRQHF